MAQGDRKSSVYRDFMRSAEWLEIRRRVIFRDRAQCRQCGSRINLEVHHRTYARFGGREEMGDLITVCEACHKRIHNQHKTK